ncbi:hypothetical protein V5799_014973 [Amblyomma americanum]|uniref:Fork-head domain-containing protein n=1 Tax=Amblyomma americanum TaxID=6943 RepID=A0AAQ4E1H2_AMBAM
MPAIPSFAPLVPHVSPGNGRPYPAVEQASREVWHVEEGRICETLFKCAPCRPIRNRSTVINKVGFLDREKVRNAWLLFACEETLSLSLEMNPNRGITGRGRAASSEPAKRSRRTRTMSSHGDTCTMPQLHPGPLAELLPAGTIVRRPPGKLVQLVAQAIHESPIKALRVRHVYEALKKRYPYFMFMDKKEQTTWEGSESRPSSRLSSSSQSLLVHTPLPSFIGSPGRQLGHMEPQLHPLVEWELKTERFATPPSPSIYLNTEQERKPKPVYSWSRGCYDLYGHQSQGYSDEVSTAADTELLNEPVPSLPYLCSPRLTHDTPVEPTSRGYGHPSPHQEPQLPLTLEQHSRPELSFARQQVQPEQEAMMPQQQFLPRPELSNSREGTLPHPELPLPPQFPWPPQELRSGQLQLPGWPYAGEPVFAAIANTRRAVMMDDGTWYILVYPAFPENDECSARAGTNLAVSP